LIGDDGRFDPFEGQLNVVDIHHLTDRARTFVLGSVLKTVFVARETMPDHFPTTYLMVDELNKYAPREGGGAIREMLLDLAERGRSLGMVLVGAEQTASQVEERVVGNCALRVVGRMESAEVARELYGWLG
jgi:DNA helicase HerA-like ATPase